MVLSPAFSGSFIAVDVDLVLPLRCEAGHEYETSRDILFPERQREREKETEENISKQDFFPE